ncbi:unnamed protein product [Schistocephalus solidus]|uniref:EB domain-containing protein n=1 Tax=Schistocephalus solidus TaxID=70667 RepID=A0A183SVM6_SCHSO|nr:unnamed protein product [Schistocephalus solidus]
MRTGILWAVPSDLNIVLCLLISIAYSSSATQHMSAVNCQTLGDTVCSKLYGNSFCDRTKGDCRCATNYVLISDGNDNSACNEVVSDEVCERDNECRQIKKSICHPGVGLCTCPFDFQFNRSAGACIADSKSLVSTYRMEPKRLDLTILPDSLKHGLMVCIITSLIASSIFCCVVFGVFLVYRQCSSSYMGLSSIRQTGSDCTSNNKHESASPALLTSLLTPCYLDLRPVEATNCTLFHGLEIKNDFNQDITQKEDEGSRMDIATQII